jgi:hypothetical protein
MGHFAILLARLVHYSVTGRHGLGLRLKQVKPRSDPRAGSVLNCHSDRVYKYRQQLPITGPDNNRSYLQYNYDRLSKKNTVYAEEDMEKEGEDCDFQNRIEDLNHQKKVKYKEVGLTYSRSMAMLKLQKMG